ncbi:MAG: condensation domain-containing protein [Candidatus Thorarchaeota archaeon]|jgi:NRPS condensation-like uncharacterized protein
MTTTNDSKEFRRRISGEERRTLVAPTFQISLGLRLRGNITEEALRNAIDKMLVTYPILGARIEWSEGDAHWSTTEGAAKVPVKVYERESEDSWIEVLNTEHSIQLRPTQGPLTRFILVKGNETSELIVFCHHIISDGRTLQLSLREVLLHLKDPDREPPIFPEALPQTPDTIPEKFKLGKLRSTMIGKFNQKWEEEKTVFDEEDLLNVWESFWKNSQYRIETIEFDKDETQKLIEISRENDVTLNSTLLVAFQKARIEALGPYDGKTKLSTAVDTRKRLRVDITDAAGYYAGSSTVQHKYKDKSSFWDNVQKFHKNLSKELKENKVFDGTLSYSSLDPTIIDAILFLIVGEQVEPHQSRYSKISEFVRSKPEVIAKTVERSKESAPDILITNLGRMELPSDIPGIEIERSLFTPSSSLIMEIVLGASTVSGRLTVTLNYHDAYYDEEKMRKIRDRAEEILRELLTE